MNGRPLVLLVLLGALGCGRPVPLEDRPCPCLEGFVCCAQSGRCVPAGEQESCAAVDAPLDAAAADGPGPEVETPADAPPGDLRGAEAAAPACGASGQACCPGNVCGNFGCCVQGGCVGNGDACFQGASCFYGSCGGVGGAGQRCLRIGCTASRTTCVGGPQGVCMSCGGRGERCCADGFCEEAPPGGSNGDPCDFQRQTAEPRTADVMLVVDRSSRLRSATSDGSTRWGQVTAGIDRVIKRFGAVNWGLKLFPSGDGCDLSPSAEVIARSGTYEAIMTSLRASEPAMGPPNTPLAAAISTAADMLGRNQLPNPGYLVLLTGPSVGCEAGAASREAVEQAFTLGFHTFVVASGIVDHSDGSIDAQLRELAQAGRRPMTGETNYAFAPDTWSLEIALEKIATELDGCVFQVPLAPRAPDFVAVEVNGVRVARDLKHQEGWDWGGNFRTLQLYGQRCLQLRANRQLPVQVIAGCPGVTP